MLRIIARHADAYNAIWPINPTQVTEHREKMVAACKDVGRDPATLELTSFTSVRVLGPGESAHPDEQAIVGTVEEVASALRRFADVGVTHLILRFEQLGVAGIERFAPVMEMLDRAI